jgi:23S rRNA pseudouridine1911/1915/1917 synthase
MQGVRLDHALALLFPEASLRERRRAWERYIVLVNGVSRPKGYRVQHGQELTLKPRPGQHSEAGPAGIPQGVRVVGQKTGVMAALFKPAGLHTEAIAGRPAPCVEAAIPHLWPSRYAQLVNRLDQQTSGLVLVALSEDVRAAYRQFEDAAKVRKRYLAVVDGQLSAPTVVRNVLDMSRRKHVKVLPDLAADPVRATHLTPLGEVGQGRTLVQATILKGARHQIRAHCAAVGIPLWRDPRYGTWEGEEAFLLHHYKVSLPEFEAAAPPLWPEWEEWSRLLGDVGGGK